MINKRKARVVYWSLLLLLLSACEPKVTRFYLLDLPIYDQELVLKWERKKNDITWSIYQATPSDCYSLLLEHRLKLRQAGVQIYLDGTWQPYIYFDKKRSISYSQTIGEKSYLIANQLMSKSNDRYWIRQVAQPPDDLALTFYISYDRHWIPDEVQLFSNHQLLTLYTLEAPVIIHRWKSCIKVKAK